MTIQQQIKNHLATQPEAKQEEVKALQQLVLKLSPKAKVWFDSGIDDKGKLVANPTIGYGLFTIQYTDGRTKEFFSNRHQYKCYGHFGVYNGFKR